MTSKATILKSIRAHTVPPAELPDLARNWIRFADPVAHFESLVGSVGGSTLRVAQSAEIPAALAALPKFAAARQIVSRVPGVTGNVDLTAATDPHDLEPVDWAVLPAEFGVAENGAVWITDSAIEQRAVLFIVQHLALVLKTSAMVHNMHEAYARLKIGQSSLGVFISGPSKTADIEQSLVIGAHGPRSLMVLLVDEV